MSFRHLLIALPLLLAAITPLQAADAPLVADTSTTSQPAFRDALITMAAQGHAPLDAEALGRFKALLKQYGWPTVVAAGRNGVDAAGKRLVRSSADYDFQNACLDVVFKRTDIDTDARAAMMINDKVEVAHNGEQQATTLFKVDHGKVVLAAPSVPKGQANGYRASYGLPPVCKDIARLQAAVDHGAPAAKLLAMPPLATKTRSIRFPALQTGLNGMATKDQAVRDAYIQSGMKAGSAQERAVIDVDAANLKRLKAIFAAHGFPDRAMVGRSGVESAWLLVQHATSDKPFMARALKKAKPLMEDGDLARPDYALLVDRVRLQEGKKQVYGSQLTGKPGHFVVRPLVDPAHVDQRRARMDLGTLASYIRETHQFYTPKPSAAASSTAPAKSGASSAKH